MWMVRVRGLGWKEDAWGGCHRIVQSTSEIQAFPAVFDCCLVNCCLV
jgi:hypothetical protein